MSKIRNMAFLAAAVAAVATQVSVQAASIGLKFGADQWADTWVTDFGGYSANIQATLPDTTVAGVASYAQAHWNNFEYNPGSTGTVSLKQSDGTTAAGMSVTWSGGWTYRGDWTDGFYGPAGNGDTLLHAGYLDSNIGNVITVTGIPYSSYDVIVYAGSTDGSRQGSVALTTSAPSGAVNGTTYFYNGFWSSGTYTLATATTQADAAHSNYEVFTGNTASSFTVTQTSLIGNSGVFGIQIVAVPEPMSASIISLGFAGLLLRRRKA